MYHWDDDDGKNAPHTKKKQKYPMQMERKKKSLSWINHHSAIQKQKRTQKSGREWVKRLNE